MSTNKADLSRLLIIGSRGMLGTTLMDVFASYAPTGWDRDEIDISNQEDVRAKIAAATPTCIINAAAYTAVDECETNREVCMKVNGDAVGYLAGAADALGALILHISTDYVFDGTNKKGYSEELDSTDPINIYGESKLRGEQQLQAATKRFYLVRTSWLYGPHGKNFVDTMLTLADKHDELKVVDDQRGRPTYTRDLADQLKTLLEEGYEYGVYHVTNAGDCTWYEFSTSIFKLSGRSTTAIPCTIDEFPRPAKRPAFSMLNNTKLPPLRHWEDALESYLHDYHS
jgi:dTDP-4-dehydrorhamnose reductase